MDMKKAQIATEYILVVGIILAILVPGVVLYVRYSADSADTIVSVKANAVANAIVTTANQVYSYGPGSQSVIDVDFPSNIDYVEFLDREVIFHIINSRGDSIEIVAVADIEFEANTIGSQDSDILIQGRRKLIVKFTELEEVAVELK